MLADIFAILISYLRVSDTCRLSHAIGLRSKNWPVDVDRVVRVALAVPPRVSTSHFLATFFDRKRCRECGHVFHGMQPRVCVPCYSDPDSFMCLLTRRDVFRLFPHNYRRKLKRLRYAKRTPQGAHLYFRDDVFMM